MIEELQCALDAGKSVHALVLDVSKAFDCVDNSFLQEKMKSLGFDVLPFKVDDELPAWTLHLYKCGALHFF